MINWKYNENFDYHHLGPYVIKFSQFAQKRYKLYLNDYLIGSFFSITPAKRVGAIMYADHLNGKEKVNSITN